MKRTIILASAAALVLSGFCMAEDKAATTQVAAPAAQTAEAAKPAAPATEAAKPAAATTEATATKPAPTTAGTTTTAAKTTPAGGAKQEVRLNVKGLTTKESADGLKTDLSKASGVWQVNVDQLTGNVTAQIDPAKTSADKLCNWVTSNKPTWNCTVSK
ncbi:MAG: hypothetical protein A3F82_05915 [Deltaproteobacteria bacterium RIFCSPLOWO2_12_FULL_44_12]|nr:MAG: hypothetical protein A2712_01390 [Deltaproteobacteria bacterium RIFCSPHIGHO2_01_FULL_43_49]OGQ15212.1 MAG: hypothetical protein A3D22_04085 [Deltaproteobacteria bacterium RIFCSPHIGHO2_02_FULL_44_53]OGQ27165.1 MAG: hypothetical protein A3D98_01980 [Deltaproteobacteria bacterium RIFCSPHIGHO2_12_FULL_44_21]OGQ31729.1 MAG: hypothetical protein A2979_05245 [Deltaproteobacteria bacterium RIFCSPLOWO2_01_FULL_45_74]OGQ42929.1 MAG: hypothetical protein A3I70_07550 [Deltaproteobacteria bacterium 